MVDQNHLVRTRLMSGSCRHRWCLAALLTASLGRRDETKNGIGNQENRDDRSQSNQETAHHDRVVEICPWNEGKIPCRLGSLLQLRMSQYEVADFVRIGIEFDRKKSDTYSGQACHRMIDLQR